MPKTKKRKHDEEELSQLTTTSEASDDNNHSSQSTKHTIINCANDIENDLFNDMQLVFGKLDSIIINLHLVDNRYFVNNHEMADEFIGKIHSFLTVYDQARKKKASNNLVSDHMFHIYEFLEWGFIFKTCQMVCKMWRETIFRRKYKIYSALSGSVGKSALIRRELY